MKKILLAGISGAAVMGIAPAMLPIWARDRFYRAP
jgi:hypothetical protein